jgi:hypothetical protein
MREAVLGEPGGEPAVGGVAGGVVVDGAEPGERVQLMVGVVGVLVGGELSGIVAGQGVGEQLVGVGQQRIVEVGAGVGVGVECDPQVV